MRGGKHGVLIGAVLLLLLHGGTAAHAAPPVERTVLPNGLVLLVSEEHSLPFVTLELILDAGTWRDTPGKDGIANLTARAILLGTSGRSVSEINERMDFMGSSMKSSCDWDFASLSMRSLKKELEQGFALFMETLTDASFPEQELQREKSVLLGAIQASNDSPMELARKEFRKILFVNGPYDHPVQGTEETVRPLTREMVSEFYRNCYQPNVAILAVVGDITMQEVREKLIPRLNQWKGKAVPESPRPTIMADGPRKSMTDRPITQANIVLGHGGIQRDDPDYYAVTIMNRILGGGGFSSRLLEAIRVRRGLAYSVRSSFSANRHPGPFQITLETRNSSAPEAVRIALEEMERMRREKVSEEELATARNYLIGSFPLRLNTQSRLASFISQAEYYKLGPDYPDRYPLLIRSVTSEDVLRVAQKYLHPDKYFLSVVGNLKEIKKNRDNGMLE